MAASNQRKGFLSNLARSLTLALVLMSLIRFLFYWNFIDRFEGIVLADLARSFVTGLRFDLLVLGFLAIPPLVLCPFARWRGRRLAGWLWPFVAYLCVAWGAVTALSFADFIYFSGAGQRLSWMTLAEPEGRELLASGWTRLGGATLAMNGGIFLCVGLIGGRRFLELLSTPPVSLPTGAFWWRWTLATLLVALAARGTLTAHHLEWTHAKISDSRVLWELTLNSPWALDKNPGRR